MQFYLLLYLVEKHIKFKDNKKMLLERKYKFYWTSRLFIAKILLSRWLPSLSQSGWCTGY